MGKPAKGQTQCSSERAQVQQLKQKQPHHLPARQPKAAQHGAGIEMAQGKAASRQGHGNAGQHHRSDTGQPQELIRSAQCAAHLTVAVLDRGDPLVGLQAILQPLLIGAQLLIAASQQQAITHAAAGLHDAGGVQILQVHQHPRRQAVKVAGAVWLMGQQRADGQAGVAHLQRITHLQLELGQQARLDPQHAGCRAGADRLLGRKGLLGNAHLAA